MSEEDQIFYMISKDHILWKVDLDRKWLLKTAKKLKQKGILVEGDVSFTMNWIKPKEAHAMLSRRGSKQRVKDRIVKEIALRSPYASQLSQVLLGTYYS